MSHSLAVSSVTRYPHLAGKVKAESRALQNQM
jgi:hypothetical protein